MAQIKNANKYYGQYVSTKSFASKDVVTHGKDLKDVYDRAREKGIVEPVILYIMDPKGIHIFQMVSMKKAIKLSDAASKAVKKHRKAVKNGTAKGVSAKVGAEQLRQLTAAKR